MPATAPSTPTPDDKPGFDPERDIELDARTLRGIAHPLRLRMLGALRLEGPQTATSLAAALAESTGTTSYHLRMLASYGFVVEEPGLGKGRERWWRAAHRSTWYDSSALDPEAQVLGQTYFESVAQLYIENIRRWLRESASYDEQWRAASNLSDATIRLTPQQARALGTELGQVVDRYRDDQERAEQSGRPVAPDSHRVAVQFQIFPRGGAAPMVRDTAPDAGAQPAS